MKRQLLLALLPLAARFDQSGSKRLRAALNNTLPALRAHGFLRGSAEVYDHLDQVRLATAEA